MQALLTWVSTKGAFTLSIYMCISNFAPRRMVLQMRFAELQSFLFLKLFQCFIRPGGMEGQHPTVRCLAVVKEHKHIKK
jgi:hypothetical protein